ncbi:ESX secretion-associated protein EspG [Allokutzneria sp. A3M-2-11 16]|uniref:ESX secretion-associated protein EspG n=1 Tax=Allokutzneria sp. A3M-2-11 16 TaxID=2962043 RepID=UPI0020B8030C|nr:ESX secretion-associated protein EspG [Allokutzneria sp. A3M-2-11 16]MCP3799658.1 ESX secretion-associated protein EspG [Allokutzneria sp. A3M-2-11 16]
MFTLSASAYQVLWERLALPQMPMELMVLPRGIEEHERRAEIARGLEELRANGLLESSELASALWVLAHAESTVDGRLWNARALTARASGRAVLGVLADDRITVRWIDPGDLARAAVAVLPPLAAGMGQTVNVPSEVLGAAARTAGASEWALVDALSAAGVPSGDARRLGNMIRGRCNGAQFGVTVASERGDRVVACFDTPAGRYLIEEQRGWTTVAPADAQRIGARVDQVLAEVVSRSHRGGSR